MNDDSLAIRGQDLSRHERAGDSTIAFGFWMYLMTDFVLFAALFATYAVLRSGTFGGPGTNDIFDMPYVLLETAALLSSSFACGIAALCAQAGSKKGTLAWLLATFALGAAFVSMEASEFARLVAAGDGPSRSGFLSSYFTLVGTHGAHVTVGLLWIVALVVAIWRRGLSRGNVRKLALFSMFWHFLDIVWIFIFTIVYLMGIL